jgi:HEAT repeat protein
MGAIREILESNRKPKEKVDLLAEKVKEDRNLFAQLVECFEAGSATDKGNCIEAMEYVSEDEPDIILPHLDFIIEQVNHAASRVRWESARIIGNVAQEYPDQIARAVPKLLANTNDTGTVVRWSAASALVEIAKNSPESQKELIPKFKEILKKEKNNGVRNIYVKALESLGQKPERERED